MKFWKLLPLLGLLACGQQETSSDPQFLASKQLRLVYHKDTTLCLGTQHLSITDETVRPPVSREIDFPGLMPCSTEPTTLARINGTVAPGQSVTIEKSSPKGGADLIRGIAGIYPDFEWKNRDLLRRPAPLKFTLEYNAQRQARLRFNQQCLEPVKTASAIKIMARPCAEWSYTWFLK